MNPKKARYRRIRGLILKLLAHSHPGSLDVVNLRFLLDDLDHPITEEEFDSHLVYLADPTKGYVTPETKRAGGVELRIVTITPAGLDLLDGFKPESDPGVDVESL